MNIYLKHYRHGTKVAMSEMEARYDEENGWVRYDVDTPDSSEAAPTEGRRRRRRITLEDSVNGLDIIDNGDN